MGDPFSFLFFAFLSTLFFPTPFLSLAVFISCAEDLSLSCMTPSRAANLCLLNFSSSSQNDAQVNDSAADGKTAI